MKIKSLAIHNFRSIKEIKFSLENYTMLVGANNAGKSNILTALRIFYEDEIKFNEKSDFPKFQTEDNESWIEIEYLLTNEEFVQLKEEYKNPNKVLRVRKYLKSHDKNRVKANQSNIYGYEDGILSANLFFKNCIINCDPSGLLPSHIATIFVEFPTKCHSLVI